MFGAIVGIAAKFIGGSSLAGGAGGILGNILGGGGLLGGLFKDGPLKEIFDMVSNFKGNFLGGAAQQPPLGNFGRGNDFAPANDRGSAVRERLLDRIERLLDRLERAGGRETSETDGCRCGSDGVDRIRELLRQLVGSNNDQNQVSFQFTRSQFLNIQA